MRKVITILIIVGVAVLGFQKLSIAEDKKPCPSSDSSFCDRVEAMQVWTCDGWVNYEKNFTNLLKEEGKVVTKEDFAQALLHKLMYLQGLIDANKTTFSLIKDKEFLVPDRQLNETFKLINEVCENPVNKDVKISSILLVINDDLVASKVGSQELSIAVDEKTQSSEESVQCGDVPVLTNGTCERWITYDDDYMKHATRFAEQNLEDDESLKNIFLMIQAQQPMVHKVAYIAGLVDAFDNAYKSLKDKQLSLYYSDIFELIKRMDIFCKKTENKDKKITDAFLKVNEEFK